MCVCVCVIRLINDTLCTLPHIFYYYICARIMMIVHNICQL